MACNIYVPQHSIKVHRQTDGRIFFLGVQIVPKSTKIHSSIQEEIHYFFFACFSGPSSLLNQMLPLFELDPLCKRTFLLANPFEAFGQIASSGNFPPVEIYTTLARILPEEPFIPIDKVGL